MDAPIVFIQTIDAHLAMRPVRFLHEHEINSFWVTSKETRKLSQVWNVDAEIRDLPTFEGAEARRPV